MVYFEQQTECDEQEINLLKEWLPKVSGEYRAYIKGASKPLLYVQEVQGVCPDTYNFESKDNTELC